MKNSGTIKKSWLTVYVAFILVAGLLSCTGNNSNTTDVKNTDSSSMKDNTMNTSTNPTEQDRILNDNTVNANNNTAMEAAFMMSAAEINMEEIKLGKLAQQKGTMKHVKELGKMMVTEHTQAMAGLSAMAKTKMVIIPATESEKIMNAYKMLNEKTGKDFDKAYSNMMVNGHKEAIALFEKTAMQTKDADVKAMTTAMIPKLKTHLEHAEMCQKECEKM